MHTCCVRMDKCIRTDCEKKTIHEQLNVIPSVIDYVVAPD